MNRTLTMRTMPSEGGTCIEVLHPLSPDVVAWKGLGLDPGAQRPLLASEDDCAVDGSILSGKQLAHAVGLLAPYLADSRALAGRLVDYAGSSEDPAQVARVLVEASDAPALGPAEEAAAFLRMFQEHSKRGDGVAWEIRTYREQRPVVRLRDIVVPAGWTPLWPDKPARDVQWFKNGDDVIRLVQNDDSVTIAIGQGTAHRELEVTTLLALRDVEEWLANAHATTRAARHSARFTPAETDEAFLAAIVAAPEDDAPRLVWADALLERGDPRGEMITGQCRLDRLDVNDAERASLLPRVLQLVALHGRKWADKRGRVFSRGFVDSAEVRWSTFAEEAESLFAIAPPIRELRFRALRNDITDYPWRVLEDRRVEALPALDLSDPCFYRDNPDDPALLFAYPFGADLITALEGRCAGLRELTMRKAGLGDESFQLLGARNGLTKLDLSHTPMRGLGKVLFGGRGLSELRTLNLARCELQDADLDWVSAMLHLEELDLGGNELGIATAELVAFLPVRGLCLYGTKFGDDGAKRLTHSASLIALELSASEVGNAGLTALASLSLLSLSVADNRFDDAGLDAFVRGRIATSIKRLSVGRKREGEDAGSRFARVLAGAHLPMLWDLDLHGTTLDGADLVALLDALPGLRVLRLGSCGVSHETLASLVAHPGFQALETLSLEHNALGPEAGAILARAPRLPLRLELADNALGDEGVRAIVQSAIAERMTHFEVPANGLTDESVRTILAETSRVRSAAVVDVARNAIGKEALRECDDTFGPRVTHDGPRVRA